MTLGQDDLHGGDVFGARDRVIEDTDATDDLLDEFDSVLQTATDCVGRIADNGLALSNAFWSLDSNDLAVLVKDFVDVGIEHESATIDSANTTESFGNAAQTEDGVNERAGVVSH